MRCYRSDWPWLCVFQFFFQQNLLFVFFPPPPPVVQPPQPLHHPPCKPPPLTKCLLGRWVLISPTLPKKTEFLEKISKHIDISTIFLRYFSERRLSLLIEILRGCGRIRPDTTLFFFFFSLQRYGLDGADDYIHWAKSGYGGGGVFSFFFVCLFVFFYLRTYSPPLPPQLQLNGRLQNLSLNVDTAKSHEVSAKVFGNQNADLIVVDISILAVFLSSI